MKQVIHVDRTGRKWVSTIANDAPASFSAFGVRQGPPPLESLGLPEETAVRLHNALVHRGILTYADCQRRPQEITGALLEVFKADAAAIATLYHNAESVTSA